MDLDSTILGAILASIIGIIGFIVIIVYIIWRSRRNQVESESVFEDETDDRPPSRKLQKNEKIIFDERVLVAPRSHEIRNTVMKEGDKIRITMIERSKRDFNFYLLNEENYNIYLKSKYFRKEISRRRKSRYLIEHEVPETGMWFFVMECSMKKLERDIHLIMYIKNQEKKK